MKVWIPIINCGLFAGETPIIFDSTFTYQQKTESSYIGFRTEQECDKWIEEHKKSFTSDEIGGCVYSQEIEDDNVTYVDTNDEIELSKDECLESLIAFLNTPIMRRKLNNDLLYCLDRYIKLNEQNE